MKLAKDGKKRMPAEDVRDLGVAVALDRETGWARDPATGIGALYVKGTTPDRDARAFLEIEWPGGRTTVNLRPDNGYKYVYYLRPDFHINRSSDDFFKFKRQFTPEGHYHITHAPRELHDFLTTDQLRSSLLACAYETILFKCFHGNRSRIVAVHLELGFAGKQWRSVSYFGEAS